MAKRGDLSRRHLLWAAAGVAAVSACSTDEQGQSGPTDQPDVADPPGPGEYRESPMLAARVDAGDLPPIEERLPAPPYVVRPGTLLHEDFVDFRPGQFGGTLQLPHDSPDADGPILVANFEPLLWTPGGFKPGAQPEGNIVAGYEANRDDTVFTFHMREGMRWSDGEPLTTRDVQFAFDDVLYHEQLGPLDEFGRQLLRAGQRPNAAVAQLTVIDDYTFSLTFDAPYGGFPARIGSSYGHILKPRHYLEQFHKDYANANELRNLLEEEGLREDEWVLLFNNKQYNQATNVTMFSAWATRL